MPRDAVSWTANVRRQLTCPRWGGGRVLTRIFHLVGMVSVACKNKYTEERNFLLKNDHFKLFIAMLVNLQIGAFSRERHADLEDPPSHRSENIFLLLN